jgi:hypothetical protein
VASWSFARSSGASFAHGGYRAFDFTHYDSLGVVPMSKKSTTLSAHSRSRSSGKPSAKAAASPVRWVIVGVLGVAVIFGAYQFIAARNSASSGAATATASSPVQGTTSADSPITGPEVDGTAQLSGGVQKIGVTVTNVYSPNVIFLKAGVPAELTFSGGSGCTIRVQSQALGFAEDLSSGPATVKLQGLQPGTYPFACGMNMVHGKVIVR